MRLGWWTGVLLVATFIGTASAEGEESVEPEKPQPPVSESASAQPFDSESMADHMDRVESRTRSNVRTNTALEGSNAPGLTKILAQLLFSLVLVVGLIYGLTYGLRRLAGRNLLNPTGPLKILAKHSVSQKSTVYLVAAFDRFLVIGETPGGLICLSEFTDPEENEERRRVWGWETAEEPAPSYVPKAASFAPVFKSHVTELEREIDRYREVSQ